MCCIDLLCAENAGAVRDCARAQLRGNISFDIITNVIAEVCVSAAVSVAGS